MDPAPVLGGTIPMIPAGEDIEQTITFYQLLGFEVVFSMDDPITLARIRRGQAQILLQRNDNLTVAQETVYRIPVLKNIDVLYQSYQDLDIWTQDDFPRLVDLEMKSWGLQEFHVLDPNRVLAVFYEPSE
ncbi:MAG: VOC family protein [Candidatus Latescibacteria bacterium]|nr:VOC family protein [Candidatus Latescibacterota bacterium]